MSSDRQTGGQHTDYHIDDMQAMTGNHCRSKVTTAADVPPRQQLSRPCDQLGIINGDVTGGGSVCSKASYLTSGFQRIISPYFSTFTRRHIRNVERLFVTFGPSADARGPIYIFGLSSGQQKVHFPRRPVLASCPLVLYLKMFLKRILVDKSCSTV